MKNRRKINYFLNINQNLLLKFFPITFENSYLILERLKNTNSKIEIKKTSYKRI